MTNQNEYKNYLLSVEDGIATLTINRPEKRNAMNNECYSELNDFMSYAETSDDIKVIIITGAGDKAFVAGADITAIATATGPTNMKGSSKGALLKMENSMKVIIAAVNGFAFGGGFELALACDIRIASENALFGLPETGLGLLPGAGGTQRLSRLAGIGVAKDVILGGRIITAAEAPSLGIAMKSVPAANLMAECKKIASDIAKKGPLAIALAKKAINVSLDTDRSTGLLLEQLAFGILLDSEDKKEGTTAFMEKRTPVFIGR